jgi:transposase
MVLRACRSSSACPVCGTISVRIHSRYLRKRGDLPWEKLPVLIFLHARKFFCAGKECRRRIFTEPLPGAALRYARRTRRAAETLDWITLALGGQAGGFRCELRWRGPDRVERSWRSTRAIRSKGASTREK